MQSNLQQVMDSLIVERCCLLFWRPRSFLEDREISSLCQEAYIEVRGEGLSIPLDQFDVTLTPGEPAALLDSLEDPQATAHWSLHALTPGDLYAASVVVEGESAGLQLSCW